MALPLALEMVTACVPAAPAAPAGVTAVTVVALITMTLVAATPPMVTAIAPLKFAPDKVIAVLPLKGPLVGDIDVRVGASWAATYVNPPESVALPFAFETMRSFAPELPAGVIAVTVVAFTTLMLVHETPPICTFMGPIRFVPVKVTKVPPMIGPVEGDIAVNNGAGVGGGGGGGGGSGGGGGGGGVVCAGT